MVESGDNRYYLLMSDGHILIPSAGDLLWTSQQCQAIFSDGSLCGRASSNRVSASQFSEYLIGPWQDKQCWVYDLDPVAVNAVIANGGSEISLRALLEWGEAAFALAGRAQQLVNGCRDHRFCGRCGAPTIPLEGEQAQYCQACQLPFYPRLSPCVIMLVTREDHCLLARKSSWKNYFSCLAGFIEVGETVENAVRREVREEVDVQLGELSYFGSQPWPFPGQLMLGFHAEYLSGDIHPDGEEIVEADWFRYDQLPPCANPATISGQLIQHFVNSRKKC